MFLQLRGGDFRAVDLGDHIAFAVDGEPHERGDEETCQESDKY